MTLGLRRRSHIEIARDVLILCNKGSNKTQILYQGNLNSVRLTVHLEALVWMGLLVRENVKGGHIIYKTTPQGLHFLNGYFGSKNHALVGVRSLKSGAKL